MSNICFQCVYFKSYYFNFMRMGQPVRLLKAGLYLTTVVSFRKIQRKQHWFPSAILDLPSREKKKCPHPPVSKKIGRETIFFYLANTETIQTSQVHFKISDLSSSGIIPPRTIFRTFFYLICAPCQNQDSSNEQ